MEMYFPRECNPVTALRALQFWKLYYHVDGFHVLGEGVSAKLLMHDGVLSDTRLMFHDFDESQIRKKRNRKTNVLHSIIRDFCRICAVF